MTAFYFQFQKTGIGVNGVHGLPVLEVVTKGRERVLGSAIILNQQIKDVHVKVYQKKKHCVSSRDVTLVSCVLCYWDLFCCVAALLCGVVLCCVLFCFCFVLIFSFCFVVLCFVYLLCFDLSCCVVLCCVLLCCVVFCCVLLCFVLLCCFLLCCI